MENSSDARKSILQLRDERQRLETILQTSGKQLPDRGANIRRRICSLEELIRSKRTNRAKRVTLLSKQHIWQDVSRQERSLSESFTSCDGEKRTSESEIKEKDSINLDTKYIAQCAKRECGPSEQERLPFSLVRRSLRHKKQPKLEVMELLDSGDEKVSCTSAQAEISGEWEQCLGSLLGKATAVYPPRGGRDCVEIRASDLERLQPDEFLNDTCIELHIKRIKEHCPFMDRCYIFNTYFFSMLVESDSREGDKCSSWTKGANIFEYDYIFVPVHECAHWSLAIVCFAGKAFDYSENSESTPCILHLDSLDGNSISGNTISKEFAASAGHATSHIASVLRSYLQAEWRRKGLGPEKVISRMGLPSRRIANIPQQLNSGDCGVFLLAFLEHFIFHLPEQINYKRLENLRTPDRPDFLAEKWLDVENVGLLRIDLLHFMYGLFLSQLSDSHPAFEVLFDKIAEYDSDPSPK